MSIPIHSHVLSQLQELTVATTSPSLYFGAMIQI